MSVTAPSKRKAKAAKPAPDGPRTDSGQPSMDSRQRCLQTTLQALGLEVRFWPWDDLFARYPPTPLIRLQAGPSPSPADVVAVWASPKDWAEIEAVGARFARHRDASVGQRAVDVEGYSWSRWARWIPADVQGSPTFQEQQSIAEAALARLGGL